MQLDDAVDMMQHMDFAYHMEQGTKTMHANRWILQDTTISVYMRLKYFNACVSAVVCFGRGHCTLYKKQFYALDVLFRKLCRSVVTPPSDTGWSLEWPEILHHWNDRARTFAQAAGLKPWSYCVFRQHCKLASHIANLPETSLGAKKFLLGIHLSDTGPWEGDRTPGTIKSKPSVDTKVWDHGWRKRNATITGLHFLKLSTRFARGEINYMQNQCT